MKYREIESRIANMLNLTRGAQAWVQARATALAARAVEG